MEHNSEREQLVWANYGLMGDPFDTRALSLFKYSRLSVENAYVPRETIGKLTPTQQLNRFLRAEGGGCVLVEGEVGVGKTSLVNHHRYTWQKAAQSLFTPISEISAEKDWTKRQFLIDLLNSLARTFITTGVEDEIEENQILMEVIATTGAYFASKSGKSWGVTVASTGVQAGKSTSTTIHKGEISNTQLLDYIRQIVMMCQKKGHRGIIFHLEYFEILLDEGVDRCSSFLDDIRDVLQIHDTYFVLVARSGFFQKVVSPLSRVRSIFHSHPIHILPFSEQEVITILNRRYELLAYKFHNYIKPVEDELVARLHKLHGGQIRNVMNDIKALVLEFSSPNRVETLATEQAWESLVSLVEEKLGVLTAGERTFLRDLPQGSFSNKELVESTGKSKQHVNKLLKKLREFNFVQPFEDSDEQHRYKLAPEFRILRGTD